MPLNQIPPRETHGGLNPFAWIQAGDWRLSHHQKSSVPFVGYRVGKRTGDTRVFNAEALEARLASKKARALMIDEEKEVAAAAEVTD